MQKKTRKKIETSRKQVNFKKDNYSSEDEVTRTKCKVKDQREKRFYKKRQDEDAQSPLQWGDACTER